MIQLQSITNFFVENSPLRRSQAKTLGALVWSLLDQPLLTTAAIGRQLSKTGTTTPKHAIKRVNRFLGNFRLDMTVAQRDLTAFVLARVSEALLTLDWTDAEDGVHQILSLNWRAHGRALPIAWETVRKDQLADRMRDIELQLCQRIAPAIPPTCRPLLVADRGFAAPSLFRGLDDLGWQWIIRVKGSVSVKVEGTWCPLYTLALSRPAHSDFPFVDYGRRAASGSYTGRLVVYAETEHPDPWYLLVSPGLTASEFSTQAVIDAYGQRFTTEECFKDSKNNRGEGFHLNAVRLTAPERWNRLWLVFAWAYYWLNVAGYIVEQRGEDRKMRANTSTRRTHALWRIGMWGLTTRRVDWRQLWGACRQFARSIPPLGWSPQAT